MLFKSERSMEETEQQIVPVAARGRPLGLWDRALPAGRLLYTKTIVLLYYSIIVLWSYSLRVV